MRLIIYASTSREASYERAVVSLIDRKAGTKPYDTECCREEGKRVDGEA